MLLLRIIARIVIGLNNRLDMLDNRPSGHRNSSSGSTGRTSMECAKKLADFLASTSGGNCGGKHRKNDYPHQPELQFKGDRREASISPLLFRHSLKRQRESRGDREITTRKGAYHLKGP